MGQHKFEQEFGQKLQKREIKPSEGSWGKLQTRLATEEKKNSRFPFRWYGVAASVVAGILIWGLSFDSDGLLQTPEIVNTQGEDIILKEKEQPEKQVVIASEENQSEEVKPEVEQVGKQKGTSPLTKTTAIAVIEKNKNTFEDSPVQEKSPVVIKVEEDLLDGMEEVIAEVNTEEENHPEVTDAEIEALLENAAAELALEHHADAAAENVDAGSLLWEVEMELERSFRDKILEVLKEGYLKTRTAVANQNF